MTTIMYTDRRLEAIKAKLYSRPNAAWMLMHIEQLINAHQEANHLLRQSIWTLTVDHPDNGIVVTVHASEQQVMDELLGLWDAAFTDEPVPDDGIVQALCNRGYVVYYDEHENPNLENGRWE